MLPLNATPPLLGFIPIARTTFDMELARQVTDAAQERLRAAGFRLARPETLVTSLDEAEDAAGQIADHAPDAVILFQATFADSTMVTLAADILDAPLLLWAVPEERTGGRLRLNSLTGINLAAHALKRAGIGYEYAYGAPDDPDVMAKVQAFAAAAGAYQALRGMRLGRVGEHPAGFETCAFDYETVARRFGVEVVPVDLQNEFFPLARATHPDEGDITLERLRDRLDGLDAVDAEATGRSLRAYAALRQLAHRENLSGLAVRCWPEFFTDLGCAACGALSLMSDAGTPCSCEADVNGTLTQIILQKLSGGAAFGADVVALDAERDGLVLWHCGLAPLAMADPEVRPTAAIHSNRRLPLLMEFPLKPGRVTLARLSEATGEYRLVIGAGEMQRAPKSFSGTSGVVQFDRPASAVLDTILSEGLEHHLSLTYGDHQAALLSLANMLELPVLRL